MAINLTTYVKDTKSEMKHVSWPTQKQTVNFTILVIGISILLGALLGIFDFVFQILLKTLIS